MVTKVLVGMLIFAIVWGAFAVVYMFKADRAFVDSAADKCKARGGEYAGVIPYQDAKHPGKILCSKGYFTVNT